MPFLLLLATGAAFVGAQIDNAIQAKFGTVVRPKDDFSLTRLLVTGGGIVLLGLGVKKLLK